MEKILVVTRHQTFVQYAVEIGLINNVVDVIAHADPEQIRGRHVLTSGLPLHLAALCHSVMTIPLNVPADLRGQELTIEDMREIAGPPTAFVVLSMEDYRIMEHESFGAQTDDPWF